MGTALRFRYGCIKLLIVLVQGSRDGEAKALAEQLDVLQESISEIISGSEASGSRGGETRDQLQSSGRRGCCSRQRLLEVLQEVVLPLFVVLLGVGFSVAALYVSLASALWPASPESGRT